MRYAIHNMQSTLCFKKPDLCHIFKLEAAPEPKNDCNCQQEAEMHPSLLKVKARMHCDYRTCKMLDEKQITDK